MDVLAAQEYPITADNALVYGSTKANLATYTSTTNPIGDIAYKTATVDELAGSEFSSCLLYTSVKS